MTTATSSPRRDPMVIIGLSTVALAAAISSFEALYGVALTAGWSKAMAPMFPITIDATAMTATRIWLATSTPTDAARRFARSVAIGAVLVSLLGNAVFHLAQAHVIHPGVAVVIAAGAVPPLALAVVCHLAVLRSAARPDRASEPAPAALGVLPAPQELTSPVSAPLPPAPSVPAPDTEPDVIADAKPDTTRTPARTSSRTDTASKIKRLRERHPDMSVVELADRLGVTDRTVRRHLAAATA